MRSKFTFLAFILSISIYAQNAQLVAKYSFEENLTNEINPAQEGFTDALLEGVIPTFEWDNSRNSTVLHQYFGLPSTNSTSFTQFPNPLQGMADVDGVSVSIWMYRFDGNVFDGLWAFFDNADSRFYLTPNAYMSYNANNVYFDANWPERMNTGAYPIGAWSMVTATADASGFQIYVNDIPAYDPTNVDWYSNVTSPPQNYVGFDFSLVVDLVKRVPYFYLGFGSWWGSAELLLDDLHIYKGVLTPDEVSDLYNGVETGKKEIRPNSIKAMYNQQTGSIVISGLQGNEKVELYTINGQQVRSVNNQSVISANNLNPGVYLVKISSRSASVTEKVIVM